MNRTTRADEADVFDRPEIFLSLGLSLIEKGKGAAVETLIAETLARQPGSALYENVARLIRTRKVPGWHAAMLRDEARNAAYRSAIEAAAPGRVVLDIGTGSGLLAMIAARAGAARVIACEANALVAEAARRIVAANALDDVITIHACHSGELKRSAIAEAGADLVMSEIFSANLVGEGVLNALDHARAELAAPGALFLPEAASLRVALAELEGLAPPPQLVEGFDLGDFASLFRPTGSVETSCAGLTLRSLPADLVRFDWSGPDPVPVTGTGRAELVATGGPANIIAQWLHIDFGGGVTYENAPFSPTTEHWPVQYSQLPDPLMTTGGTRHAVHAFYHTEALSLWAD